MSKADTSAIPGSRAATLARLDIRGPALLGLLVSVVFFGAGLGAAAIVPLDKGVSFAGAVVVETRTHAVQHQRGGNVGRIHVREGQQVEAGDVLVTLDAKDIDDQIAALREQSEASKRQLALIREEARTFTALADRQLAARSKVLALERQVAQVEKENSQLSARILAASQELQRMEIRAPVAGRILTLGVRSGGAVLQPGQTVAEIVPENDRLVIEGRMSPMQIEATRPGMPAKVWLRALSWRESRPFKARLAWVSPDSVEDRRTGQAYFVARVELEDSRSEIADRLAIHPGMRAEMLLLTGERTLLDQLLDPLIRNMHRAFRA